VAQIAARAALRGLATGTAVLVLAAPIVGFFVAASIVLFIIFGVLL